MAVEAFVRSKDAVGKFEKYLVLNKQACKRTIKPV